MKRVSILAAVDRLAHGHAVVVVVEVAPSRNKSAVLESGVDVVVVGPGAKVDVGQQQCPALGQALLGGNELGLGRGVRRVLQCGLAVHRNQVGG